MKTFISVFLFLICLSTSTLASSSSDFAKEKAFSETQVEQKRRAFTSENSTQNKRVLKLATKIQKKLIRKAKRKGIKTNVEFVDVATLAGAIVCILGVISIIFSPLGGLIVAALGLLIYLIGKSQGGEINNIIQAIEDEA